MNRIYKLEAELDLTKEKGIIKIKPIADSAWGNLGFYLEVVGFLALKSLQTANALGTPKTLEEVAEYIKQYVLKAGSDYEDVTYN